MRARNHRLKIGEQGMVGFVAQSGQPHIALDVGTDAVFFDNPDLPNTRSEMALPLQIGQKVIGVLDIQSIEASAFAEEDIRILSSLAHQVSLAIENARLFEQTNRSLAEAEALSRLYLREGWSQIATEENISGYRYTPHGILALEKPREEEASSAHRIEIPVLLRGEQVGLLMIHPGQDAELTPAQVDIARAVADRVALSAENARLFGEVSRRAERERTVTQITTNIRNTTDPQVMIQTALADLRSVLGAQKVEIRPYFPSDSNPVQFPEVGPARGTEQQDGNPPD